MENKVAIITLGIYNNFGNRLQNYALERFLTQLGYDVETLFDDRYIDVQCIPKLKDFSSEFLHEKYIKYTDLGLYDEQYSYFIVGSDQVWNPSFGMVNSNLDYYFLQSISKHKRISYAASFGVKKIPKNYEVEYAFNLLEMNYISIRENEGQAIVNSLTAKNAPVLVDPALLLQKNEWLNICKPFSGKGEEDYILIDFICGIDNQTILWIQNIANAYNMKIYDINYLLSQNEIGPCEIVDFINDAKLVCTDSYHASVISIIMNTPFVYFNIFREDVISRVNNLLSIFGYENRMSDKISMDNLFSMDFSKVEEIQKREIQRSKEFLSKALHREISSFKENCICNYELCTGCGACEQKCPQNAITMAATSEGFLYPQVDKTKCTNCGICEKICLSKNKNSVNENNGKAYAVFSIDSITRKKSASGGIFSVIAKYILDRKGVVFGAKFDEHFNVVHDYIDDIADIKCLNGSKYVQSSIGEMYKTAEKFLKADQYVLFSGTPCQIAGLYAYLGKEYEKLICIDLICHGVPSPKEWRKYLKQCEKIGNGKINEIIFRDKNFLWENQVMTIKYDNGEEYHNPTVMDPFTVNFLQDNSLRESCYNCMHKGSKRNSDFTIGDFWGIDKILPEVNDHKGISLLIPHSNKAMNIINEIKNLIQIYEVPLEEAIKYNPSFENSAMASERRLYYFDEEV